MTFTPSQVLEAVKDGRITAREADAYLKATRGASFESVVKPRHVRAYLVAIFLLSAVVLSLFLPEGSLTGFVTLNTTPEGNITTTDIPVDSMITRISASGTMYGDGTATLVFEGGGNYTLATIRSDRGTPRTAQASYAPGDEVMLQYADGANVYLDDGNGIAPVTVPFAAPAVGRYELLVLMNVSGEITTTRTPLIVSDTPVARETVFSGECGEACAIPASAGVLHVIADGTTVTLALDVAYAMPNRAPVTLPFNDLALDAPVTIDLGPHFLDPDEDALMYTTSPGIHVVPTLDGALLTLTPVSSGEETFIVYASDLQELVQESFTITVTDATNATTNETANETVPIATNGTTINETLPDVTPPDTNGTNVTLPDATGNLTALDCSNADPNLRPIACLQGNATEYFPDESVLWLDLDRNPVAELNEIGNLLIKGDIVPYSTGEPGPRDYRIGLPDRDGNVAAAAWIDAAGNLNLRGALYEENQVMQPPPGSYSVITKRSIYLVYVDYGTGDMYLRGNLIPYRRSLA